LEVESADEGAALYWARDDEDGGVWHAGTGPLTFAESATLRMVAELDGVRSPVVRASLRHIAHRWTVSFASDPAPQYSADGPASLVDGRRGALDWRTGAWLGWQGQDVEAVLDLGERTTVSRVTAGFLQDVRSWIWMPTEVTFALSVDGERYRDVARITPPLPADDYEVSRFDFTESFDESEARYVRIRAATFGTIPGWHLGSGGKAWIFVDEIVVE
jgi:hypothetical protein